MAGPITSWLFASAISAKNTSTATNSTPPQVSIGFPKLQSLPLASWRLAYIATAGGDMFHATSMTV